MLGLILVAVSYADGAWAASDISIPFSKETVRCDYQVTASGTHAVVDIGLSIRNLNLPSATKHYVAGEYKRIAVTDSNPCDLVDELLAKAEQSGGFVKANYSINGCKQGGYSEWGHYFVRFHEYIYFTFENGLKIHSYAGADPNVAPNAPWCESTGKATIQRISRDVNNPISVSIPFSEQNAECGERTTVNVDLRRVLDAHTKNTHKIFTNRESGIEPPNLPKYCQDYFFPLLTMAAKSGGRLDGKLLVYPTFDQCCKIVGGSIYSPKFECWDVPAEMAHLTLPNGTTLRSKVKDQECPLY
jgi:hypothetical protein